MLNGTTRLHLALEEELADHYGTEAAVLTSSGHQRQRRAAVDDRRPGDVLLVDAHAHASVHAGAAASRGTVSRFRHNDLVSLAQRLERLEDRAGAVIVVDGVYSMTGELAPLAEDRGALRPLRRPARRRRGARLGVLGEPTAAAPPRRPACCDRVDAVTDRLQQVAGQRRRRGARPRARPPTASVPPPCPTCSAPPTTPRRSAPRSPPCGSCAASRSGWPATRENGELLRRSLAEAGAPPLPGRGAVIAVPTGDEEVTAAAWRAAFDAGVYVNAVAYPGRPARQGRPAAVGHGHPHRRAAAPRRRDRGRGGRAPPGGGSERAVA